MRGLWGSLGPPKKGIEQSEAEKAPPRQESW
jgi:hypothetical protein